MLQWLVKTVDTALNDKQSFLPKKVVKDVQPIVYWVQLPNNKSFDDTTYDCRNKFNLTLESIIKQFSNMRMMQLKEIWDMNDTSSVTNNGQLSEEGVGKYWEALDAAFRFNMEKRTEYLAREAAKSLQRSMVDKTINQQRNYRWKGNYEDRNSNDKFHWSREPREPRSSNENDNRNYIRNPQLTRNRFLGDRIVLPKPSHPH